MNSITLRQIVCLESEDEINRLRHEQHRHEYHGNGSSLLRDARWREIAIKAGADRIQVSLGNIDEEGAKGEPVNVRYACRQFNLTWPDLADVDGLEKLLQFEVMAVAKKVLAMLSHLGELSTEARDLLAI